MKKHVRKLALTFDTLRHLQAPSLRRAAGGADAVPEESAACNTDACFSSECISHEHGAPCGNTNWSIINLGCQYSNP